MTQLTTHFTQAKVNQEYDLSQRYQAEIDALQNDLTDLQEQEEDIGNQLMRTVAYLVQTSMAEVSALNKLLVPLISLMRTELELPFNSDHFARILEKGNDELEAYMASFFKEYEQALNGEQENI